VLNQPNQRSQWLSNYKKTKYFDSFSSKNEIKI
jgi:hypothetical protein